MKLSGTQMITQNKLFQYWNTLRPITLKSGNGFSRYGALLLVTAIFTSVFFTLNADAATRKLKLYYLHTGEKATIAFKRDGKFLPRGLKRLNVFLRDWRHNEPTKMDPNLFDLIWEVYRKSGSRDYIHVISGYRSPATNNMLRRRGHGVAKRSQHMLGKAMDFFLPDVKLAKLRKIGLLMQVGGVGFYPTSGSPFVHMDTGRVRHWPRMTRKQLVRIFPNGKTLHIPTDGKPLPGYNQAVASYNQRVSGKKIAMATGTKKERKNFFQRLASLRHADDKEDNASNFTPSPRRVSTRKKPAIAKPPAIIKPITAKPPATITAPADNPEPLPQQPPQLPLLAAIPVPSIAPRKSNAELAPEQLVLAADTTNQSEKIDPDPEQQPDILASVIPVPSSRPAYNPVQLARADLAPASPISLDHQRIALQASNSKLPDAASNNLRSQLIAQAQKQLREHISNRFKARQPSIPRPSVDVGTNIEVATLTPRQNETVNPQALTRSFRRPKPEIKTAVEAAPNPAIAKSEITAPTPVPRPELFNTQPDPNAALVTAFAPVETTRQVKSDNEQSLFVAAIPTPAPRKNAIHTKKRDASPTPDVQIAVPAKSPARQNRTGTRDTVSVAWLESNQTGKYALYNSVTNGTGDKIRAPAYGQAAIRRSPDRVLSAGFEPMAQVQISSRFTGNAVKFQTFTRFN